MQIGDKVFYPMHGAGIISGVETCEVLGENKEYFVLKMPLGSMKVMIPTDNVENLGLRSIISKEEVEEIQTVLRDKPERVMGSWNKRFHAILERMKKGDILDVAAVTRNLSLQDRRRKISSGERRLMDLARQMLISELVYACDKTPEEVEQWIDDQLDRKSA
ncbi:MAG: CarD family transcriptional regulator [Selenomonadaceae bacterium]|nr:CarD family transcriptional regulator [Selenomonadaceae bacterium]